MPLAVRRLRAAWAPIRARLTRQTRTALAAAVCFVTLAVLLAVVPVPYVTWGPGGTQDTLGSVGGQPVIAVRGASTYPTSGELDLTTVSVSRPDSLVSLPQALTAYWSPHRDALPREAVYPATKSADQVEQEETVQMESAQSGAVVAALRAAGQPVQEYPAVASITVGGPASGRLQPGDLIRSVDGASVRAPGDVPPLVRRHRPGESVTFTVLRNGAGKRVAVTTAPSPTDQAVASVGITVGLGYRYRPRISFELGQRIGGPSAGLVFALAIYDKLTPGALLVGRHVAGTGTITTDGQVGRIGGIQEKIATAEAHHAAAFLVPAGNCADLAGVDTSMTLIRVAELAEGIAALRTLATPGGAERTPRCQ